MTTSPRPPLLFARLDRGRLQARSGRLTLTVEPAGKTAKGTPYYAATVTVGGRRLAGAKPFMHPQAAQAWLQSWQARQRSPAAGGRP